MKKSDSIFSQKSSVKGRLVAIMNFSRQDRGIIITGFQTRCLQKHEIHEFILCSNKEIPTRPIDHVWYLGFGEIIEGGVVAIGDSVHIGDKQIGIILGFDETHMPNHYNVIIKTVTPQTGLEMATKVSDEFSINFVPNK